MPTTLNTRNIALRAIRIPERILRVIRPPYL
jgi:hypothetical protein